MDLESVLKKLAEKRPVFHSEADFQFALAWEIKSMYPEATLRLEYPFSYELVSGNKKGYIDILVGYQECTYPIELKYKTVGAKITDGAGDFYRLANQAAQNLGCYDFLKDIARLECMARDDNRVTGFTVWLTNDSTYWERPEQAREDAASAPFRVYNGLLKTGHMEWQGERKRTDRKAPIVLKGEYPISWHTYSDSQQKNGCFKYAINQVKFDSMVLV